MTGECWTYEQGEPLDVVWLVQALGQLDYQLLVIQERSQRVNCHLEALEFGLGENHDKASWPVGPVLVNYINQYDPYKQLLIASKEYSSTPTAKSVQQPTPIPFCELKIQPPKIETTIFEKEVHSPAET